MEDRKVSFYQWLPLFTPSSTGFLESYLPQNIVTLTFELKVSIVVLKL